MDKEFAEELEKAESFSDIFELVKDAVWKVLGESRAGLELGLIEMGITRSGFIGGMHQIGSNIILMNKTPLRNILENDPKLFKPYVFHILLHEYIHSLGFVDEASCRRLTYHISNKTLGKNHPATKMAYNLGEFLPKIVRPTAIQPNLDDATLVKDFDRSSISYIE
mgnify:CR=1 FL=1